MKLSRPESVTLLAVGVALRGDDCSPSVADVFITSSSVGLGSGTDAFGFFLLRLPVRSREQSMSLMTTMDLPFV